MGRLAFTSPVHSSVHSSATPTCFHLCSHALVQLYVSSASCGSPVPRSPPGSSGLAQQTSHGNCFLWILLVSPAVTVSQSSTSSGLVAVTCHVQRFYPQSVYVTWLEDCHPQNGTKQPLSKMNQDGSYSLESSYVVNMSAQRTERVFTCRVQHEAQSPIQASLILSTAAHTPLSSGEVLLVRMMPRDRARRGSVIIAAEVLATLTVCSSLNHQNSFWPGASCRAGPLGSL